MTEIFMPKAGMDMKEGRLIRWLKEIGDHVEKDEPIMEIETDKITMEAEAPATGILLAKLIDDETTVPVLQTIGYIGQPGEKIPDAPIAAADTPAAAPVETAAETAAPASKLPVPNGSVAATPYAKKLAAEKGVELADAAEKTWGNALYACFDQKVEEHLVQPTFITMYPVEVSPLTKKSPEDPRLTERFEFFINRREMGNAYSELNDPIDQRERFMKQVEQRERGDDETEMLDEDFLTALEYGMPPTGGMGMGIDRAVMLFTGTDTIREVILFPTMKPQD